MFGHNPKRAAVNSDGRMLDVQEIFPTLQGEGPHTGMPSVFIRLGGCNLACEFCDTEFESFKNISVDAVVETAVKLSKDETGKRVRNLIVLTGGEPFRQPIEYLCRKLLDEKFIVQIETNGTLYRDIPKEVEIICSPKNTNKYSQIRDDLMSRITALKFIISVGNEKYSFVPEVGQKKYSTPVYIQPMDEYEPEKNKANLDLVEKLSKENDYKVSIQMHKIWGIP